MHIRMLIADTFVPIPNVEAKERLLQLILEKNPVLAKMLAKRSHDLVLFHRWDGSVETLKQLKGCFIVYLSDDHFVKLSQDRKSVRNDMDNFAQEGNRLGHLLITSQDTYLSHFGDLRTDDFDARLNEYLDAAEIWTAGH